jgi:hypothetical protein
LKRTGNITTLQVLLNYLTIKKRPGSVDIYRFRVYIESMTTQDQHRILYPEQYNHPAVGRKIRHGSRIGTILRVVRNQVGLLAHSDVFPDDTAYSLDACEFIN